MDLLPTKKKINRQHRRRFADIETISKFRYFSWRYRYDMANIDSIYRLGDISLHHYSWRKGSSQRTQATQQAKRNVNYKWCLFLHCVRSTKIMALICHRERASIHHISLETNKSTGVRFYSSLTGKAGII